ncbi:MAG: sugar ABC transporter substrate-binding protein [Chloroflexi bacterium]|nr:sugar ABC transporter substrate-binding protein [Chloroflexota bacterium]
MNSRSLNRRQFLVSTGALAAGATLAACAPQPVTAPAAPAASSGAASTAAGAFDWKRFSGSQVRITTLQFPISDIQQARIAAFEELTGIKVNWEELAEDQWRQKVKVEHLAGTTDMSGFLSYWGQEGKQFMESGWYTDLKPLLDDPSMTNKDFNWGDYTQNLRDAAVIDGKIPIIPDRGSALPILYYRRDLFEQYKLEKPKTWDDVMNAAKTIFEGSKGEIFGIVLRGKGAAATSMFGPLLYDLGGEWFDRKTGDVAFNTPEALAAFEWWGKILREYGPPGSVNNHWAEVTSIFSQGRAAMCYDDIVFASTFGDKEKSTVVGKVGYSVAPTGPHSDAWRKLPPYAQGVSGLAISGLNKEPGPAWYLIQYMSDHETAKQYMLKGGLSPRQSVWDDPDVVKALDPEFLEAAKASGVINGPGAAPLSISNVAQARDYIGQVIVTAIQGGDVKAAQQTAYDQCVKLLADERAQKS